MKVLNEDLMEQIMDSENLRSAWKVVKGNKGCSGIDGIEVSSFIEHIRPHWPKVREKVLNGNYKPAPVKRVYIPKGKGEKRPLGIPTVQDRFLQQAILQILEPLFDPCFSEHSYGFRPHRSAHDAVKAAQSFLKGGKEWLVDIDLKSFFDEVNQDILMRRMSEVIPDKRVLHLIGKYLRAGVMEEGKVQRSNKGVPQGSPLSPLLANIYLDALDKELEARQLSFARYADDCNIYVSSRKAAERVFKSITSWIEKKLKLPINRDKSNHGEPWDRQFLGYQQTKQGELKPSAKAITKFKDRVRFFFNSRRNITKEELLNSWLKYIRGWCNYFSLADERFWRRPLSSWVRRHIRKFLWQRWHNAKGRKNALLKLGMSVKAIEKANLSGSAWPMAKQPIMHMALNNKRLKAWGFWVPLDFAIT